VLTWLQAAVEHPPFDVLTDGRSTRVTLSLATLRTDVSGGREMMDSHMQNT
jgi:hypothetical protein